MINKTGRVQNVIPLAKRRISLAKNKIADPIEIEEEGTYILSLFNDFSLISKFEGSDFNESSKVANVHAVFAIDLC